MFAERKRFFFLRRNSESWTSDRSKCCFPSEPQNKPGASSAERIMCAPAGRRCADSTHHLGQFQHRGAQAADVGVVPGVHHVQVGAQSARLAPPSLRLVLEARTWQEINGGKSSPVFPRWAVIEAGIVTDFSSEFSLTLF